MCKPVFYASEHAATTVAEPAYWRLLFFSRSPRLVPPTAVVEHTAFTAPIAVDRVLDLTVAPFDERAARWSNPADYGACQDFAARARAIDAQAIRYGSARDPDHRANVALFDPQAFEASVPTFEQTWHFRYEAGQITAYAAFPSSERYAFSFDEFGLSPP